MLGVRPPKKGRKRRPSFGLERIQRCSTALPLLNWLLLFCFWASVWFGNRKRECGASTSLISDAAADFQLGCAHWEVSFSLKISDPFCLRARAPSITRPTCGDRWKGSCGWNSETNGRKARQIEFFFFNYFLKIIQTTILKWIYLKRIKKIQSLK